MAPLAQCRSATAVRGDPISTNIISPPGTHPLFVTLQVQLANEYDLDPVGK